MEKIPIDSLLVTANEKIKKLRDRLRNEADKVIPDIPRAGKIITGNIYVESVESIIEFDEYGNFEFVYTPDSLTLRNPSLSESERQRERIFDEISKQFPEYSRILNIGAGGDIIPPICMENSGHEIISTDLSQSTINILANNINSPLFACDLIYLNDILPENSIDFFIGNSTLGYVDPRKIAKVLKNISKVMKYGGIFTFDLTPHPVYFQAQEQKKYQTVANASEIDPKKLIELVEKYGNINGINAMAYYSYFRTHFTNIAVLLLLKELFENEGLECTASWIPFDTEYGANKTQLFLRVSKNFPQILNFLNDEREINKDSIAVVTAENKIWYRLASIDRDNGEVLAKKFGIHTTRKEDPWSVVSYIHEHLSAKDLPSEIKDEILQEIDPWKLSLKIRPFLHGENIPKQIPLPWDIIADQTMHKMVIDGSTSMTKEEADIKIDQAYREHKNRKVLKQQRAQQRYTQKITKKTAKNKRKQARKSRKKIGKG